MQGYHRMINGTVDLKLILRFPVDGICWLTYMKLLEDYPIGKSKKTAHRSVFCIDSDVQITAARLQRGNKSQKQPRT